MCNSRSRVFAAALLVGLAFAFPGRLLAQNWNDELGLAPEDVGLIQECDHFKLVPVPPDKAVEAIHRGEIPQQIPPQPAPPPVAPARSSTGLLLVGIAVGSVLGALLTLAVLRWARKAKT